MSREHTKNTLMSRQLDLLQNLCERLRTDNKKHLNFNAK